MPIDRLRKRDRMQIAWLRVDPPSDAKRIFQERNFSVGRFDEKDCRDPAKLSGLCAVVFTQNPKQEMEIRADIEKYSELFLNFGCLVILRVVHTSREAISGVLKNRIFAAGLPHYAKRAARYWQDPNGDPPIPYARIFPDTASWHEIANVLGENPIGPAPNFNLKIVVSDSHGDECFSFINESELLIRRAFFDCTRVRLVTMPGGRSALGVFRAYPELAKGQNPRSFPLPYFVKIERRQRITDEYRNYEDWVDPYIPFHLGPHLIRERCGLGAHNGILVGDYVDASESLLDVARSGRASPAIACLFDTALQGWYRGAQLKKEPITKFIDIPKKIHEIRINRARELGGKIDLTELRDLLLLCDAPEVLVGSIHGDLHGDNVRVRGNDAILIDFAAHHPAPLVYDVASLEASLLVRGFSSGPYWTAEAWLKSILPLYDGSPLSTSPLHCDPGETAHWFYDAVRQLRHHAQRMERPQSNQYAAALAVALIVRANKDPDASEPEASRMAGAFVLAEKVLTQTFGTKAATKEVADKD